MGSTRFSCKHPQVSFAGAELPEPKTNVAIRRFHNFALFIRLFPGVLSIIEILQQLRPVGGLLHEASIIFDRANDFLISCLLPNRR